MELSKEELRILEFALDKWRTHIEAGNYSWERVGHDFWLTRNSHGAGFWDRPELKVNNLGDKLTGLCSSFRSIGLVLTPEGFTYGRLYL